MGQNRKQLAKIWKYWVKIKKKKNGGSNLADEYAKKTSDLAKIQYYGV